MQGNQGLWMCCAWALPVADSEAPVLAMSTGSTVEALQVQAAGCALHDALACKSFKAFDARLQAVKCA